MDHGPDDASTDLIRWTFRTDPTFATEIEDHLDGLGADVLVRDRTHFQVTWEEPTHSLDDAIEAIWSINGVPFDVTQEEFHRLGLHHLQHAEDEGARDAA